MPSRSAVDAQTEDATARLRIIGQWSQFEQAKVGLLAAIGLLNDLGTQR